VVGADNDAAPASPPAATRSRQRPHGVAVGGGPRRATAAMHASLAGGGAGAGSGSMGGSLGWSGGSLGWSGGSLGWSARTARAMIRVAASISSSQRGASTVRSPTPLAVCKRSCMRQRAPGDRVMMISPLTARATSSPTRWARARTSSAWSGQPVGTRQVSGSPPARVAAPRICRRMTTGAARKSCLPGPHCRYATVRLVRSTRRDRGSVSERQAFPERIAGRAPARVPW
jgi:hypothetical protein